MALPFPADARQDKAFSDTTSGNQSEIFIFLIFFKGNEGRRKNFFGVLFTYNFILEMLLNVWECICDISRYVVVDLEQRSLGQIKKMYECNSTVQYIYILIWHPPRNHGIWVQMQYQSVDYKSRIVEMIILTRAFYMNINLPAKRYFDECSCEKVAAEFNSSFNKVLAIYLWQLCNHANRFWSTISFIENLGLMERTIVIEQNLWQ